MVLPIGQVPKTRPTFGSGLKPGQLPASVSGRQRPPQGFGQPPRFGQRPGPPRRFAPTTGRFTPPPSGRAATIANVPNERISPSYQPPTGSEEGRASPQTTAPGLRVSDPNWQPPYQGTRPGPYVPDPANPPPPPATRPYPSPSEDRLRARLSTMTDEEYFGLFSIPGWENRYQQQTLDAIRIEGRNRMQTSQYQQQPGGATTPGNPPTQQPPNPRLPSLPNPSTDHLSPEFRPQLPAQPPAPTTAEDGQSGTRPVWIPGRGWSDRQWQAYGQQPQQQPGGFPSPEITSGINPQPVFAPYQTQTAVNQAMGSAQQAALTPGRGYLPGISQGSPALQSRNVVTQAGALAGGQQQAEQIRLGDRMTNVQALLQGQQARAQDVLGQAGNRFGISATNQQYGNQMANLMLSSILSRLGGAGNLLGQSLGDRDFWARLGLAGQQGRTGDILSRFGTLGQLYDTGGY